MMIKFRTLEGYKFIQTDQIINLEFEGLYNGQGLTKIICKNGKEFIVFGSMSVVAQKINGE